MFKQCLIAAAIACVTSAALAQPYPNKPVKMLVGYTPGGAVDAGVRPLSRVLEVLLGQPIIIEYKPGAAGGVAMEMIAKVPPDGYTLHYFDSGPLTVASSRPSAPAPCWCARPPPCSATPMSRA